MPVIKVGTHEITSPATSGQVPTFSSESIRGDQNLVPVTCPMNSKWFEGNIPGDLSPQIVFVPSCELWDWSPRSNTVQ